jgi:hypothetical protein
VSGVTESPCTIGRSDDIAVLSIVVVWFSSSVEALGMSAS